MLLVASLVAWGAATSKAGAVTSGGFVCYGAAPAAAPRGTAAYPAFVPVGGVGVVDRFASSDPDDRHAVDLRAVETLCAPAAVGAPGVAVPALHLEGYRLRQSRMRPRQPAFAPREYAVIGPVAQASLMVAKPEALLVPSALAVGASGAPAADTSSSDEFQCYAVRALAAGAPQLLTVADSFGEHVYDVGRPTRLCLPADRNGQDLGAPAHPGQLLCYRARLARTRPRQARPDAIVVSTQNALGAEVLHLSAPREICVPVTALGDPQATATSTPQDTATPQAAPTPTTASPGSPKPTATAAALLRITIRPPEIARLPTEVKHFWATGNYADGSTRDLTSEVVWASSDPAVATAPNEPGDANRMDLHAPGTTLISATHPATGVSSTATGDDAVLHVTGPLNFIAVQPLNGRASRDGYEQFTAIGYYQKDLTSYEYVTRNLTQDVHWSTTDPAVASADNPVGDRSRVVAHAPGITGVYATDPTTGIQSWYCPEPGAYGPGGYCSAPRLMVLGDLQTITLIPTGYPREFYNLRIGDKARLAAIGHYEGGGFQYITQECMFAAENAAIFGTPNLLGDRGVIEALSGGTTNLTATHVVTGIVSAPFSHYVYGDVVGISIPSWMLRPLAYPLSPVVPFGDLVAIYTYGTGPLLSWEATVDDPTIAVVNGRAVVPLRPGTVSVGVRDVESGVESTDRRTVTFYGDLQRVLLRPVTVALRVGGEDQLTALADHEGGYLRPVTQESTYTSSDPAIVAAPNDYTSPPHLSRIVGLAPGEAMISATFDGRSSSDSGDDTFVTVVGDLTTLTVTPPQAVASVGRRAQFTATGADAAARSINVTQTSEWSSSDAGVAAATNPDGDRSRIDGIAPGTVTVTATDPISGRTGTATLTVIGTIGSLTLLPETESLAVGATDYLTAVGVAVDGTLNLTQDVVYASDAPTVVAVANDADARSRIVALAPGTARITATDPLSGLVSDPTVVTVH